MAEHFSFFDAVQLEDGTYEEEYEYDAQKFTNYFRTLVTTGVMKSAGNMLAVSTSGSNMVTKVNTGIAFIEGRYYENDSFKELTHDTETLGNSRIDRIVIRMDLSTEARYVKAFIKKGVPSKNPVAPTLTQTPNLYEISLAQVKIIGGQTFIATNAVTDERGIDVICPWAGSKILPNFDNNVVLENMMTLDGKAREFNGDYDTLRKSGIYVGHKVKGATNLPDGFATTYLVEVYMIDEMGSGFQIARTSSEPSLPMVRAGFANGLWNRWERPINQSTVVYIDAALGDDAPGQGYGPGEKACKTSLFATSLLSNINSKRVTLEFAAGNYANLNISDKFDAEIKVAGSGKDVTYFNEISLSNCSNVSIRDLTIITSVDIRSVDRFNIQGIKKTISWNQHGVYVLTSTGSIWSSEISNCTGSYAGIKADNGSYLILDSVSGTGNGIGIDVQLGTVRRRSSTITGSTPTKATNGGQII